MASDDSMTSHSVLQEGGGDSDEKDWLSLMVEPRQDGCGNKKEEEEGHGCMRRKESLKERGLERAWEMKKYKVMDEEMDSVNNSSPIEERGILVFERRGRSLCMDKEEVKACRDLGLELQQDLMVEIPRRISCSAFDTDSGGNSPIANWRISSPGDNPRDVKARLKIWAHAVAALASSSHIDG
ncbi:uncharacterized protein LOC143855190 [Tasmannia lanceolata]|uniref:uncharacterized protein LOC143855190 n=1 Tax=Tasmannia lanceolata TaxID=3420 RepID=UPI0040635BFE